MNKYIKSILILGGLLAVSGCNRESEKPIEEYFMSQREANLNDYILDDLNKDTNIDCVRIWEAGSVVVLYRDTAATKGIPVPGNEFILKPMSPEMVKASNDLRDAYNKFQFERLMVEYNLDKNR
jgi:hypothetical protein